MNVFLSTTRFLPLFIKGLTIKSPVGQKNRRGNLFRYLLANLLPLPPAEARKADQADRGQSEGGRLGDGSNAEHR